MPDHAPLENIPPAEAPSSRGMGDCGRSSDILGPESQQTESQETACDSPHKSTDAESRRTEEDAETREEQNDLDFDGIGRIKKGPKMESKRIGNLDEGLSKAQHDSESESKRIGNLDESLSKALDDSKTGLSDSHAPVLFRGKGSRVRSPATEDPHGPVTLFNFGSVELTGTTDDVVIGHETEYRHSVKVQRIVHRDEEGMLQAAGDSAVRRRRGLSSSGEASPKAARRTGMVLREDGSAARGGNRNGSAKTGNGLLLRHLLGRKVESAAWIPIAVFSCITFIVITIGSFIFGYFLPRRDAVTPSLICKPTEYPECFQISPKKNPEALPKLQHTEIIPRIMWQAKPPLETTPMKHPVEYVVISHTAAEQCYEQAGCSEQVRIIQKFHVESRGWSDIGYNFLVGGDGNAYEGRGWEYVGAHAKGYNAVSMGISFIGTFTDVLPPPAQIRACKLLIKEGVIRNKISKNYKLIAHRQVSPTESPGEKLYEELQNWDHWSPEV